MHPRPKPLTLIVATTPVPVPVPIPTRLPPESTSNSRIRLGIGLNGTLPWPRIKTDMSFFARVTSRPPSPPPTPSASASSMDSTTTTRQQVKVNGTTATNAIIMGRKTYDSIPAKLRPLGKRVNVVISRDRDGSVRERVERELRGKREGTSSDSTPGTGVAAGTGTVSGQQGQGQGQGQPQTDALVCSGIEDAVRILEGENGNGGERRQFGNLYVIGGAEIYAAALGFRDKERKVRIVMTNVERLDGGVFECDTFFPGEEEILGERGWRRVSAAEVTEWVGETVTGDWIEEGEVRVQMVGYERVD